MRNPTKAASLLKRMKKLFFSSEAIHADTIEEKQKRMKTK